MRKLFHAVDTVTAKHQTTQIILHILSYKDTFTMGLCYIWYTKLPVAFSNGGEGLVDISSLTQLKNKFKM